jgi:hypothetical protein
MFLYYSDTFVMWESSIMQKLALVNMLWVLTSFISESMNSNVGISLIVRLLSLPPPLYVY